MGNNPMSGVTVAVAVAIEEAFKYKKYPIAHFLQLH